MFVDGHGDGEETAGGQLASVMGTPDTATAYLCSGTIQISLTACTECEVFFTVPALEVSVSPDLSHEHSTHIPPALDHQHRQQTAPLSPLSTSHCNPSCLLQNRLFSDPHWHPGGLLCPVHDAVHWRCIWQPGPGRVLESVPAAGPAPHRHTLLYQVSFVIQLQQSCYASVVGQQCTAVSPHTCVHSDGRSGSCQSVPLQCIGSVFSNLVLATHSNLCMPLALHCIATHFCTR